MTKRKGKINNKRAQKFKSSRMPGREKDLPIYFYVEERGKILAKEIATLIKRNSSGRGGIVFVHGPIFSGKTVVGIYLAKYLGKKAKLAVAKYQFERPDAVNEYLYTRMSLKIPAVSFKTRKEIEALFDDHGVVVMDEFSFFPYKLQSFFLKELDDFVEGGGWFVGLSLLYSSQRTEFLLSAMIRNRALRVYRLTATCQKCGRRGADREQRLVDGTPSLARDHELEPSSKRVVYEARCKDCHVLYS